MHRETLLGLAMEMLLTMCKPTLQINQRFNALDEQRSQALDNMQN
jgi:hypothetical protein